MSLGELVYYEVGSRYGTGPANLFMMETSAGPVRGVRLDHPTKTWKFDPQTVWEILMDDADDKLEGGSISMVGRPRAEEVSHLLGAVLPTEAELHRLMRNGAREQGTPFEDWEER